jgi:type IV fimbrial biogenesis protein FimT
VISMFLQPNIIMQRTSSPDSKLGFSLIELLIAISIAAILLVMAAPSFTSFLNANRVTSQANELLATFQIARIESIRRGVSVVVCGSSNANSAAPSCSGSSTWGGWIAFVDTDRDNVFDTGEKLLQANLLSGMTATTSTKIASGIIFRPDGLARKSDGNILEGKVALCIPTTTPAENARDVAFALGGGRITVKKRNAGIGCSAPTDAN